MTAATALPANAAGAAPRWLPWLFLALLVLPFHPYWLDFEQVRRGLLVALVGARLLTWQRSSVRTDRNAGWLWIALLWTVPWPWNGPCDLLTGLYLIALLFLPRLGAELGRGAWLSPAAFFLLATSAFGIAQRLGFAAVAGYGTIGEPVSVFGNLNVAAEFTVVAAAAALELGLARPRLGAAALATAGAYLVVNGSRSGAVALPAAALWFLFAVQAATARKLSLLLALGLGAAAGACVLAMGPAPETTVTAGTAPLIEQRARKTGEVRLEIAKSCWRMFCDAPVCGHGIGQFQVQYPRYRSQEEIEVSSLHRQFEARVQSAHDDWLQILVEGGLPALLLWLLAGIGVLRGSRGDRARALPLLAFAALMAVRSPLGNAPCAMLAFLLSTAPSAAAVRGRRGSALRVWLQRALGLAMAFAGVQPLLLNQRIAPCQSAQAHGLPVDLPELAAVNSRFGSDPRVDQWLAQEYRNAGRLDDALAAVDRALAAWPHEPSFHLLRAEILVLRGSLDGSKAALDRAAALDPGHPQLIVQYAAIYFSKRDHDAAVTLLYHDPHPTLLAVVARNCDEFARLSAARKDDAGERRWRAEACLRRALDSTGATDLAAQALANERFLLAKDACTQAGLQKDPRVLALIALLALDAAHPDQADRAAGGVAEPLQPWQVNALGTEHGAPRADRLRRLGSWRPLLPRP